MVRYLLLAIGWLSVALGVIGIFLPVLPTTPFLLLAAACFARAYRPFHEWMLGHRWLGPMLKEWYQHGSLPYRTKIVAIATMLVSFGLSILLVVTQPWLQALLAMMALENQPALPLGGGQPSDRSPRARALSMSWVSMVK